jgi:8-oxo-dGTP diphosphatase
VKLGVLVYLENNDEHVLMIHREKEDEHQGLWLAPGGKVEPNEAPYETAVRETLEETGLIIKDPELKAVLSFPDEGDSPFGEEWLVFVFYTNSFSGTLTTDCPEGLLEWIPKNELTELTTWEGDRLFTPRILESGCFSAKFIYSRKSLLDYTFSG